MSFLTKFNEICRTCLKGGQLLTYLYDEENSKNLVKKLKSCTALQFDKNDQMPDKICPTCIEELLQAYNFINKCQISDATLKKYLLNESFVVTKIEDIPPSEEYEIIKLEQNHEDTNDETTDNEHFDLISDISFKDELIDDKTEINTKKRKREDDTEAAECFVDLSVKKSASECDNVLFNASNLNNTFSTFVESENSARPVRKTRSEIGKENFAIKPKKNILGVRSYGSRKRTMKMCPICRKKFGNVKRLLTHLQSHTETDIDLNEKAHSSTTKLTKQTAKENHINQCQICKKRFNETPQLLNHYKQHINAHKCEFCSQIYLNSLRRHILAKHTGTLPYFCEMCHEKLPDADALQSHKNVAHSVEKPHRCTICFYTFDTLMELKEHGVVHVGGAPFICQTCKNVFEDAHCLIAHKFDEKCGKFYVCGNCPMIFQLIRLRNTHKMECN